MSLAVQTAAQLPHSAKAGGAGSAAAVLEEILGLPDAQLDYARAKLAFDRLVDPTLDEGFVLAELARLTDQARSMAGADAGDDARLAALRTLI